MEQRPEVLAREIGLEGLAVRRAPRPLPLRVSNGGAQSEELDDVGSPRVDGERQPNGDDAVGAGRGRDLEAVTLRGVLLDGVGQIDRPRALGHAHRVHRRGADRRNEKQNQSDQ